MPKSILSLACVLCAAMLLLVPGGVCSAGMVEFTIDPGQSYLTASGSYSGFDFGEQIARIDDVLLRGYHRR